ncbi:OmpA family protein [Eikenella glucosivorans]|nr:OmpA family protein [Eikenella glucosivorans]
MNLKTLSVVLAALFAVSACGGQQSGAAQDASAASQASAVSDAAAVSEASAAAVSDAAASTASEGVVVSQPQGAAPTGLSSLSDSGMKESARNMAQGDTLATRETAQGTAVNLSSDVLFDFGQAGLKPEADAALEKVAAMINERGAAAKVTIVGYTDAKGSAEYNRRLSVSRAQSVKDWLVRHGVKQAIAVEGKGAADPVAPNAKPDGSDNPEGRAQNRRVEILIASGEAGK